MGVTPLVGITVLYLWATWSQFQRGDYPMTLVFFTYALSNVGLIWKVWS
jgi:hypothetical protein